MNIYMIQLKLWLYNFTLFIDPHTSFFFKKKKNHIQILSLEKGTGVSAFLIVFKGTLILLVWDPHTEKQTSKTFKTSPGVGLSHVFVTSLRVVFKHQTHRYLFRLMYYFLDGNIITSIDRQHFALILWTNEHSSSSNDLVFSKRHNKRDERHILSVLCQCCLANDLKVCPNSALATKRTNEH